MKKITLAIIFFWLLIVCIVVIFQESIVFIGRDVFLKTKPIDPRDILRGDYVDLKFEISEIEDDEIQVNYKKPLYVVLELDNNNIAHVKKAQFKKPKDELFIKGKISSYFSGTSKKEVEYGIESYFVKSKEAKRYEKELAKGGFAHVKIDKFGRARVISLKKSLLDD